MHYHSGMYVRLTNDLIINDWESPQLYCVECKRGQIFQLVDYFNVNGFWKAVGMFPKLDDYVSIMNEFIGNFVPVSAIDLAKLRIKNDV